MCTWTLRICCAIVCCAAHCVVFIVVLGVVSIGVICLTSIEAFNITATQSQFCYNMAQSSTLRDKSVIVPTLVYSSVKKNKRMTAH